jgi:hypothetical protein
MIVGCPIDRRLGGRGTSPDFCGDSVLHIWDVTAAQVVFGYAVYEEYGLYLSW